MRLGQPAILWAALALIAGPLASEAQRALRTRPRIFLDCNAPNCNSQYFRTEINWVNWVNDREVADVHVIMGSVQTGAGGRAYQLDFIGLDPSEGYEDQLLYEQIPTDTERESLDGLTHTLALGIAAWANTHGFRGLVRLQNRSVRGDVNYRTTASAGFPASVARAVVGEASAVEAGEGGRASASPPTTRSSAPFHDHLRSRGPADRSPGRRSKLRNDPSC